MQSKKKAGIYQIRNLKTDEVYIGQTCNLVLRWRGHLLFLRRGNHTCHKLQAEWNRLGGSFFKFEVLQALGSLPAYDAKLVKAEKNWQAKTPNCLGPHELDSHRRLTHDDIRAIRTRRASGETCESLSHEYKITKAYIYAVCLFRRGKHIS